MTLDTEKFKQLLLDRRAELEADAASSADSRGPVELDQSRVGRLSRMDALQSQAMAQETDRRRHQELLRIDHALELMDEGEYGLCQHCGADIASKRLEFDPAATLCIDCARQASDG